MRHPTTLLRLTPALLAGLLISASCSSDNSTTDDASTTTATVADSEGAVVAGGSNEAVIDGPGTISGTGLTEIDITGELRRGAIAIQFELPDAAAAYVLDEGSAPLESIEVGTLDSTAGLLLIDDLENARKLQVDTEGDWVVSLVSEVRADLLDEPISGSGNRVVRLADGVVDVVIDGSGCPSGLEVSSWGSENDLLSAELFIDDELPATITPPNFTELINVRGPCAWTLTPR